MHFDKLKIKKILTKIKYFGILLFPVALYFIPVNWLNEQHTICLYKNIFGHDCFGCGITRAVLSVMHFDFVGAYNYNKLVIIVFPLLIYVWIRFVIKPFIRLIKSYKLSK